jgi:hypothetical protein
MTCHSEPTVPFVPCPKSHGTRQPLDIVGQVSFVALWRVFWEKSVAGKIWPKGRVGRGIFGSPYTLSLKQHKRHKRLNPNNSRGFSACRVSTGTALFGLKRHTPVSDLPAALGSDFRASRAGPPIKGRNGPIRPFPAAHLMSTYRHSVENVDDFTFLEPARPLAICRARRKPLQRPAFLGCHGSLGLAGTPWATPPCLPGPPTMASATIPPQPS